MNLQNVNKKLLITIITILSTIVIMGIPKLFLNKKDEVLPEVKLKEIEKSKSFAIMVPNNNGDGYISYSGTEWPTSDNDYYYVKSECIDNNGNKIDNAISYNEENNTASLTTNSTVYCTLYFDKYNYMKVPLHDVSYGESTTLAPVYMSSKVKKVEFVDNTDISKATEHWDLTDTTKSPVGSVIAWVEPIEGGENYVTLYIGSKSKMMATSLSSAFMASEYSSGTWSSVITNLETINFNNKLDISKITSLDRAFFSNNKLKSIKGIENWNTKNLRSVSDLFYGCSNLDDFSFLVNFDVSNVTNMFNLFNGCIKFDDKDIFYIKDWDVSKVINMSTLFRNASISDISPLQNWIIKSLEYMPGMFISCTNLKNINAINNWDVTTVTDMFNLFNGCSSLNVINLSNWNTQNLSRTGRMFFGCTSLQTIDMRNATFIQITERNNFENMFAYVPQSTIIIVKDENQKNWLIEKKTDLNYIDLQIKLPNEL